MSRKPAEPADVHGSPAAAEPAIESDHRSPENTPRLSLLAEFAGRGTISMDFS